VELAGPASLFFTGMGRVTDSAGAAGDRISGLSSVPFGRRPCGALCMPGGAIKAVIRRSPSGKPFACLPLVSLAKCPKI
jgi:hypothetical protein